MGQVKISAHGFIKEILQPHTNQLGKTTQTIGLETAPDEVFYCIFGGKVLEVIPKIKLHDRVHIEARILPDRQVKLHQPKNAVIAIVTHISILE